MFLDSVEYEESFWLFLLPLAFFILLRAPLLHFPPFGDEDLLIRDAVLLCNSVSTGYPIMGILLLKIGLFFLNWSQLRWVPFLFSIGVFILTALMG